MWKWLLPAHYTSSATAVASYLTDAKSAKHNNWSITTESMRGVLMLIHVKMQIMSWCVHKQWYGVMLDKVKYTVMYSCTAFIKQSLTCACPLTFFMLCFYYIPCLMETAICIAITNCEFYIELWLLIKIQILYCNIWSIYVLCLLWCNCILYLWHYWNGSRYSWNMVGD